MPLGTETEEKLFEILRNGELQQFNTIDFSEISDSQLSKLHSQLSLSLSNQREADCRIIQLLMQCHLLNHVKFFLSNYIDKYDDTDDRIKRAVVQYFDLIGQVYIIHRIVKRKTYQNSSDSVVSYFSSISRENNDIDELFGDELVLIIRKTNTERKRARERVRTEYKNTWRTEIRRLKRFSSTDFNSQALLHLKNLSLWDRDI